ncbi:hypothetical protein R3P38DRAFT_3253657 [Favolaschia claudopus]|uniref:Uncharacterized protein n=1 Tax=Favolaschia claudopus TaxID=2862362 RepID=A0AAW0DWK1_9AGAR
MSLERTLREGLGIRSYSETVVGKTQKLVENVVAELARLRVRFQPFSRLLPHLKLKPKREFSRGRHLSSSSVIAGPTAATATGDTPSNSAILSTTSPALLVAESLQYRCYVPNAASMSVFFSPPHSQLSLAHVFVVDVGVYFRPPSADYQERAFDFHPPSVKEPMSTDRDGVRRRCCSSDTTLGCLRTMSRAAC